MPEPLSRLLSRPDVLAYGIIPLLGALVGWWTNRIATGMMFVPRTSYGWQGVIPSKLQEIVRGLIEPPRTGKHLVTDALDRIDPTEMARSLEPEYDDLVWNVIEGVLSRRTPRLWEMLPSDAREQLFHHLRADLPEMTATALRDETASLSETREFAEQLRRVFADRLEPWLRDRLENRAPSVWEVLPGVVQMEILRKIRERVPHLVAQLIRDVIQRPAEFMDVDRHLYTYVDNHRDDILDSLEHLFRRGMRRVERTGLWVGLLVGLGQGVLIQHTTVSLLGVLSLGGLAVGLITNAVALVALFRPRKRRELGPIHFQGAFPEAREKLAGWLGEWAEQGPFAPGRIMKALFSGGTKILKTVRVFVHGLLDRAGGPLSGVVSMILAPEEYFRIKDAVTESVLDELPRVLESGHEYVRDRMDLSAYLQLQIQTLPSKQYANLFQPSVGGTLAILLVGSMLGLGVGILELVLLYGKPVSIHVLVETGALIPL